jgi:hypothetical protein
MPRASTPPRGRSASWPRDLRLVKFLIGLLLLPFCSGAGSALLRVLRATGSADTVWVPLMAGGACWLAVYYFLPRPMWLYVAGHELTHALWTWAFGGQVKGIRVGSGGGHVIATKSNFLITLAPYFFPFYVAVIVFVFMAGNLIWDWSRAMPWFHLLVGAAYSFHVTLTAHVLQTRQSDITRHGYVFSGVVIWLGNVGVLLLGVPLLTAQVDLVTALRWCLDDTIRLFMDLGRLVTG